MCMLLMSFRGLSGTYSRSHQEHDGAGDQAVSTDWRIDWMNVLSADRGSLRSDRLLHRDRRPCGPGIHRQLEALRKSADVVWESEQLSANKRGDRCRGGGRSIASWAFEEDPPRME